MNGLQYLCEQVDPPVLREVDLREGEEVHRRVEISLCALAHEATLCAAITQASCQGEEFGKCVCIRDMASEHMTLEMLRVCTSRVRHGDDSRAQRQRLARTHALFHPHLQRPHRHQRRSR